MRKPVPGALITSDFSIRPDPARPRTRSSTATCPFGIRSPPASIGTNSSSPSAITSGAIDGNSSAETTAATTSHTANGPPSPPLCPGSITQNPEPPPRFDGNASHTVRRNRVSRRHDNPPNRRSEAQTPKCGKPVKLFSYGTKVLSLIPHHFHPYTLKDIWRVFRLDLVS